MYFEMISFIMNELFNDSFVNIILIERYCIYSIQSKSLVILQHYKQIFSFYWREHQFIHLLITKKCWLWSMKWKRKSDHHDMSFIVYFLRFMSRKDIWNHFQFPFSSLDKFCDYFNKILLNLRSKWWLSIRNTIILKIWYHILGHILTLNFNSIISIACICTRMLHSIKIPISV